MRITLHAEGDLTLSDILGPGMDVVSQAPDLSYSALEMFAASLALCTASVVIAYGEQMGAGADNLTVRVRWVYAERPFRVARMDVDVRWPECPESRLQAARRAAESCTLHHTLHDPPQVTTRVRNR